MFKITGKQKELYVSTKQAILSGEYKVGDKLPYEAELAEKFSVSRSVVREALSALKTDGYVDSKRGRNGGYIVVDCTMDVLVDRLMDQLLTGQVSLRQAAEMRLKLEVDACRTGIAHISEETIAALYRLDEAFCSATNSSEATELNAQFHSCIGSMAGNSLQGLFLTLCLRFVGKAAEILTKDTDEFLVLHSKDEHRRIIESIKARDADNACFYIEQHILAAVERLEKQEKLLLTRTVHASFNESLSPAKT
jgi:DNA-binding FadR family transcriptional regulator